jgi:hypothetical protein
LENRLRIVQPTALDHVEESQVQASKGEALALDFDKRFETALKAAISEVGQDEMPALANALGELRDYILRWKEMSQERLISLGVYSMTPEQYTLWLDIMAKALAERTIQEARDREERKRQDWWQFWQIRVAVLAGASSVFALVVGGAVELIRLR